MKTSLCCDVIQRLQGKTLVSAESLTGGGIGAALTGVSGSSAVYKGGIISYTNWVKETVLGVPDEVLQRYGAVSAWTAGHMVSGVRKLLQADIAVSVTGLAGPGGDDFGNPVGTVYIGYEDAKQSLVRRFLFV
ncbi:CinA family protein, partial [Enterococcus faecalis]|uniref:CinA family protein n=1 Tax=Enterococcus faecalis TaxID=1351 RepID=UPI001AD7467D